MRSVRPTAFGVIKGLGDTRSFSAMPFPVLGRAWKPFRFKAQGLGILSGYVSAAWDPFPNASRRLGTSSSGDGTRCRRQRHRRQHRFVQPPPPMLAHGRAQPARRGATPSRTLRCLNNRILSHLRLRQPQSQQSYLRQNARPSPRYALSTTGCSSSFPLDKNGAASDRPDRSSCMPAGYFPRRRPYLAKRAETGKDDALRPDRLPRRRCRLSFRHGRLLAHHRFLDPS